MFVLNTIAEMFNALKLKLGDTLCLKAAGMFGNLPAVIVSIVPVPRTAGPPTKKALQPSIRQRQQQRQNQDTEEEEEIFDAGSPIDNELAAEALAGLMDLGNSLVSLPKDIDTAAAALKRELVEETDMKGSFGADALLSGQQQPQQEQQQQKEELYESSDKERVVDEPAGGSYFYKGADLVL